MPSTLLFLSKCFLIIFFVDNPTVSGMSDMDYPLQGPGLLSVPNLPDISSIRRVLLPPELVEQFGRILFLCVNYLKYLKISVLIITVFVLCLIMCTSSCKDFI